MYISEVPQISNVPKPVSSTARGANNIWDFSPAVYIYIQKHIYIDIDIYINVEMRDSQTVLIMYV